jgi:hypothetical protein
MLILSYLVPSICTELAIGHLFCRLPLQSVGRPYGI